MIGVQYQAMRWTPRVTVAAVIENEGRFLVVEEEQGNQTVINQPAGHLEDGESLQDAVVREVLEESAWHFIPDAVTGIYRWVHPVKAITFLRVCYTGKIDNHYPERELDPGIIRTHWLTRDELIASNLRSPMVLRCVDDYLAGQRHPLTMFHDIK